ncbi:MAG: nuclear transport factor 2 family protein [Methylobacteriaceae bacterium]|nr:nuclear transport factor 2 family protein [Methylobacteriaceae bacterium]
MRPILMKQSSCITRPRPNFVKGNPADYKMMFSDRWERVSLGNPFGPFACGWKQVAETMERAASLYRDGEIVGFENVAKYVTPGLAYIVEVERIKAKIAGRQEVASVALRSTSILRPEGGTWKIVHRHADPITAAQPPESIIASAKDP